MQAEENIYGFMRDGILEIRHCNRLRDVVRIIEELKSDQALKCVHTINIYTNVLCEHDELWVVLQDFMQKTNNVTNLLLHHCDKNKESTCSIARMIEILCEFKNVSHLELVSGDSKYSLDDIHMLRTYFNSSTTIKNLRLEAHYRTIRNIAGSIERNGSIETVDLIIHNMYHVKSTTPIFVLHKIKKISFIDCNISLDHATQFNAFFESFLASHPTIDELNLYSVPVNVSMIRIISDFIKGHNGLMTLHICHCGIDDERICGLVEALKMSNVAELAVSNNNIGYEGAVCIADVFKLNNSLKLVDITHNPVTHRGLIKILKALVSNSTLREFYCTSTISVMDGTIESIAQTFEKILSDNYTLTFFVVILQFKQDDRECYEWVGLENIIQRNKEAIKNTRFAGTKVATN